VFSEYPVISHTTIPRRIIQTGKTRELSLLEQAAVANLTSLNPDFEYVFFDDADIIEFIEREFPEYRATFEAFPLQIQRIDFFRYLAVYRLGGFYFDLDVLLARSIGGLTSAQCVFPFEELTLCEYLRDEHQIDWEIGNYGFGSVPGHPFLRAVIDNTIRSQSDPAWASVMMKGIPSIFRRDFRVLFTTGPGMLTRTLAENPHLVEHVDILFPDDVCNSSSWHQFGHYGVHMMSASWRTRGSYLRRRLASMWETRVRRRLLPKSQKEGKQRLRPRVAQK
jgi:inositol phosphorylceramide mannosyltransferase catalytic subunit